VEKYGRAGHSPDDDWRMHIARWMPKATSTPSEYIYLTLTVFHGNGGYTKMPEYYVLCALPVSFNLHLILNQYCQPLFSLRYICSI
jgi:hypothetical protein